MKRAVLGVSLLTLAASCAGLPEDHPERIDWLRILAVAAEPPELPIGESVSLEALVDVPDGSTPSFDWYLCNPLVVAQNEGVDIDGSLCAEPEGWTEIGAGAPLQLTVPDIGEPAQPGDPFYLPVVVSVHTDTERYWSLKRVYLSASLPANENPVVDALVVDKDEGTDTVTVPPDSQVPLQTLSTDPNGDPVEMEYFVTAGVMDGNRAAPEARVFWTTPGEPGPVTIYAVARDGRGGTGWRMRQAVVGP